MKVRIIKPVRMKGAPSVQILEGSVVELPGDDAASWISRGYASLDTEKKSPAGIMDKGPGGAETASIEPWENAMMKRPAAKKVVKK